jgi:hypothetical protein
MKQFLFLYCNTQRIYNGNKRFQLPRLKNWLHNPPLLPLEYNESGIPILSSEINWRAQSSMFDLIKFFDLQAHHGRTDGKELQLRTERQIWTYAFDLLRKYKYRDRGASIWYGSQQSSLTSQNSNFICPSFAGSCFSLWANMRSSSLDLIIHRSEWEMWHLRVAGPSLRIGKPTRPLMESEMMMMLKN